MSIFHSRHLVSGELDLRPYKQKHDTALTPEHEVRRVNCCKAFKIRFPRKKHRRIIFTDEMYFSVEQVGIGH